MSAESGLLRVGPFIVLSGTALRTALQTTLIAIKQRRLSGLPYQTYEALACEFQTAMAAAGHLAVHPPAVSEAVPVEPTVPLNEAAIRLNLSRRQASRLAPQLGGQKVGGRWFLDETALAQHLEGRQQ